MWRTLRRIARVLAWVVLSLILLVLVAAVTLILWARSPSGRRIILSRVVSTAQKRLRGRLTIGGLEGDLTRELALRDVRLYDRERTLAVSVEVIRAEYDLLGLLRRQVRVGSLAVQGARVHARYLQDGQLNLTRLTRQEPKEAGPEVPPSDGRGWEIAVRAIHADAELLVDGRSERAPARATLDVTGGVRWGAGGPTFRDLRARLVTDGHELDGVQSWAHLQGPLEATLRVDGAREGIDAELALTPAHGQARAQVFLSLPSGGDPVWRATLRAENLDPGALLARAPHGDVELAAQAHGQGRAGTIDVERMTLDVAGTHASAQGAVEVGARLAADVRAEVRSSDLSPLSGLGLPELHGTLDAHAHVRRVPSHTFVDAAIQARSLRIGAARLASLEARVHAKDLEGNVVVEARDLEAARAAHEGPGAVRVRSFALRATGDEAHLALTVDASGPHGVLGRLRAHGAPLPDEGRWAVDVTLDTLVVGAREQQWRLAAPGRVRVDRRALFAALALASGEQTLALDGKIEGGSGRLDLFVHGRHLDASRLAQLARAQAELPHTDLDLDAQVRGARAAPELVLKLDGRTLPWTRHGIPAVALALDAAATGRRVHGTVEASATGQTLRAQLDAPLDPSANEALVAELHASGIMLEPLRPLLPPSLQSLAGRADLDADVSGTARDPELSARLDVPVWSVGTLPGSRLLVDMTYRRARLDARLDARFGDGGRAGVLVAELELPIDLTPDPGRWLTPDPGRWLTPDPGRWLTPDPGRWLTPAHGPPEHRGWRDRLAHTMPLALHVRGRSLDLSRLPLERFGVRTRIHEGVGELTLDVGGTLHAPEARLQAEAHRLRVAKVDGVDLTLAAAYERRRATATLNGAIAGGGGVVVRAESPLDVQRIVDGLPWREVPVTADVTIPAFDLARVQSLGGTVEGRAEVRGTLAHPTAKAELHALDLRVSDSRLAKLEARAAWDGRALTATLDGNGAEKGTLHLDVHVPADANAPMHATLKADAFTFALDDLGDVRRLEGTLAADLHVDGPRVHPAFSGFLRIDHGAFAGGSDPRLFQDLTLELAADDGTVELRRLALAAGRGKLTAHGHAELDGLQLRTLELVAEADRFPFHSSNAAAWLDARIELHGRRVGDTLEGTLNVSQGRARLPTRSAQKELQPTAPLEDVVYVDAAAPPRPEATEADRHGAGPRALHVVAHIPGPFRIDSQEMHAELRGELEVRTSDAGLGIYGHAETTTGRFELLGRQYEIERARASFDGEIDPVVDVRLTRALADTKVVISVHGTASAPQLELTSDPPLYDSSQVLGIIVSGDPDNQRIDAPSVDRQLAGAVSGIVASKIKGQIIPGLPIDVIKVDTTASEESAGRLSGARIEVGKYVRQNIYVSYIHQLGTTMSDLHRTNTHEANIDYRFRRHFVVGVRYGDAGVGAIDLSWTLRY